MARPNCLLLTLVGTARELAFLLLPDSASCEPIRELSVDIREQVYSFASGKLKRRYLLPVDRYEVSNIYATPVSEY